MESTETLPSARLGSAGRGVMTAPAVCVLDTGVTRGHPLLVARELWNDVPDEGFRGREPLLVPCDDLGEPGDVDFPGDLPERFRSTPGEPM